MGRHYKYPIPYQSFLSRCSIQGGFICLSLCYDGLRWSFTNSVIPSVFISQHFMERKRFPLFYVCLSIIYLDSWILILFNGLYSSLMFLFILMFSCPKFNQWEPFQAASCVLLTCSHRSLSTSSLFGTIRCF